MACCGEASVKGRAGDRNGPMLFEYRGEGPFTTFGRVTGIRYLFAERGARLTVDRRDVPAIRLIAGVTEISGDGREGH